MCLTPCLPRGQVHLGRIGKVEAQRLLAHHMLAAGNAGQRDLLVREVGRRNDDRVDVGIVGDLLIIRRDLLTPPVAHSLPQQLFVRVANGDQFGPRINGDAGNMVIIGNRPGSDDGVTNHEGRSG